MNREQILAAMKALLDNADGWSKDHQAQFDALKVLAESAGVSSDEYEPENGFPVRPRQVKPDLPRAEFGKAAPVKQIQPAKGLRCFSDPKTAETFGHYILSSMGNFSSLR